MGTFSHLINLSCSKSQGESYEKTKRAEKECPIPCNSKDQPGRIHSSRVQNQGIISASGKKSQEKIRF